MRFFELIRLDFFAYSNGGRSKLGALSALGFYVVLFYRLSSGLRRNNLKVFGFVFDAAAKIIFNCHINSEAEIGGGLRLEHATGIVIGKGVRIGRDCTIYQNVTLGGKGSSYPCIGSGVTVYPLVVVIGDLVVGDNAIIGAGSVLLSNVPAFGVAAGNPAKLIKVI